MHQRTQGCIYAEHGLPFHILTLLICPIQDFNKERLAAEAAEKARLQAIADKEAEEEALRNAVIDP